MEKSTHSSEYEIFLRELRAAREEAGVTQSELAENLGSTQSQISKCERGERRIDVVELRRWMHALGGSLGAFTERFEAAVGPRQRRSRRSKK